ncbi:hypothetical protein QTP88_012569 [Uroleucon formosanum]
MILHQCERLDLEVGSLFFDYVLPTYIEDDSLFPPILWAQVPSLNPSIMIDYERAVLNAIETEFCDTEVKACFFHMSQCIWRHVQELGLQTTYRNDPEFSLRIRMLPALAFIPEADVIKCYNALLATSCYTDNEDLLAPLLDYFENTWVGKLDRRGKRKTPKKGGAERDREKNKKLLAKCAEKCNQLDSFFLKGTPTEVTGNKDSRQLLAGYSGSEVLSKDTIFENTASNFMKPKYHTLEYFFKIHPVQPHDDSTLPFVSRKAFYRKNQTIRTWCTYDETNVKMFCSVCLAFSIDKNPFTYGMCDWKHICQRISEHENSKAHNQCCEAYFMHIQKRDVGFLLMENQMHQQREEVKKNRQVLDRIIEVCKVIGKRGLSVRGKRNEAAYFLKDPTLDHGTFLEMIILISKYDAVLNEHINNIINKSEKMHLQGSKGRGNFVSLLSHYSINNVISTISSIIKQTISSQISKAQMFSVLIDTTQDVTVMDQCSIVLRYVTNGTINEKLIAVKCCTDSTGKGMMELLQSALEEVKVNPEKCIGNATDGAANMQGVYNGFTAWLSKVAPEQIHVWCFSHVLNLVITDATKNPVPVVNFFSLINAC